MAVCESIVNEAGEAMLSDLLSQWHVWSASFGMVHGYASSSAMFRQAKSSRQYDDANGGLDAHIDAVLMEGVDGVMVGIAQPHNTALAMHARNLATGRAVWSSPRLPSCPLLRAQLVNEARKIFASGLARAGLI